MGDERHGVLSYMGLDGSDLVIILKRAKLSFNHSIGRPHS